MQDGVRHHLKFTRSAILFPVTLVWQISVCKPNLVQIVQNWMRYAGLCIFKMAAVRHVGFVFPILDHPRRFPWWAIFSLLKIWLGYCDFTTLLIWLEIAYLGRFWQFWGHWPLKVSRHCCSPKYMQFARTHVFWDIARKIGSGVSSIGLFK